jgi:hypothetical protein
MCPVIPTSSQDGHQAGMKCRTQFWKGTTKGSFQQSLVEIGSVVSEVKIFFKFHPLKIEISSIVHCCFSISQIELKF